MKMNQEVKQKWLAALRSNKYSQGTLRLRSKDNEFCCLGVLCDVHSQETGTPWGDPNGEFQPYLYLDSSSGLPREVLEWAGIEFGLGLIEDYPSPRNYLSSLNDIERMTFEQIADVVEKYL